MTGILERLLEDQNLTCSEAESLAHELAAGRVEPPLAGALLAALRSKGECPEEVRGLATGMRAMARQPAIDRDGTVDVVGTGGDGSGSLNLSTGSALLAAACGLRVVKHGNRSVSSRSGSADVIEALGLPIPLDEGAASRCLDATGFTFLFAPYYHPAMSALAGIRRSLGVRTVFNLLGPLTNPASPPFLLVGAWSEAAARLIGDALVGLDVERAFVVHGSPGWDEATPVGEFILYEVACGRVGREVRDAAALGIPRCDAADLLGRGAKHNADRLRSALYDERGPHQDALVLGAALALELTGEEPRPRDAVARARDAIESGRANQLIDRLSTFVGVSSA